MNDHADRAAIEESLRQRVEDFKIFLETTDSSPQRQVAMDAYAEAVEELDKFLASSPANKETIGGSKVNPSPPSKGGVFS
jgi:hypothetical protein